MASSVHRAFCLIRSEPHYRRDAFMAGLKAAGYEAHTGGPTSASPGDVLLIWNRYSEFDEIATRFERRGGTVLVAENGYVGPGGVSPHQMNPRAIYALAIGGHNGSGTSAVGGLERWAALGVELKPWRTDGDYVLVLPNRPFGRPDLIMPIGWPKDVARRMSAVTKRPVRIRPHPGNGAHRTPLADDLRGALAAVVWSSSAGVHALIAGVPVVCEGPAWICKSAAFSTNPPLQRAPKATWDIARLAAMQRLAWAQWSVEEIAIGEPFRYLLQREAVPC